MSRSISKRINNNCNYSQPFPLAFAVQLPQQADRINLILKSTVDRFVTKYQSKTYYKVSQFHKDFINIHTQIKIYQEKLQQMFKKFTKWQSVYNMIYGINKANQNLLNFMDKQMMNRRLYYNTPGNQTNDLQRDSIYQKLSNMNQKCLKCQRYCDQQRVKLQKKELVNYPFQDPYDYFEDGVLRKKILVQTTEIQQPLPKLKCLDFNSMNQKIYALNQNTQHLEYQINNCLTQFQALQTRLLTFHTANHQKYIGQNFNSKIQKQFKDFTSRLILIIKQIWAKKNYKQKCDEQTQIEQNMFVKTVNGKQDKQKRKFQQEMRNLSKTKDKKIKQLGQENINLSNKLFETQKDLIKYTLESKLANQEKQRLQVQLFQLKKQYYNVSNDLDELKMRNNHNVKKDTVWQQSSKNLIKTSKKLIRTGYKHKNDASGLAKSMKILNKVQQYSILTDEDNNLASSKNCQGQQNKDFPNQQEQIQKQEIKQQEQIYPRSSKKSNSMIPKLMKKKSGVSNLSDINNMEFLKLTSGNSNQNKEYSIQKQGYNSVDQQKAFQEHENDQFKDVSIKLKKNKRTSAGPSNFKQLDLKKIGRKPGSKKNLTATIFSSKKNIQSGNQTDSPNKSKKDAKMGSKFVIEQENQYRQQETEYNIMTCKSIKEKLQKANNSQENKQQIIFDQTVRKFYNLMNKNNERNQLKNVMDYQSFKTKFNKFLETISDFKQDSIYCRVDVGTQTANVSTIASKVGSIKNQKKNYAMRKAKLQMSHKFDFNYIQTPTQIQSNNKDDIVFREKTNTQYCTLESGSFPSIHPQSSSTFSTFHRYPRLTQKIKDYAKNVSNYRNSQSQSPKKISNQQEALHDEQISSTIKNSQNFKQKLFTNDDVKNIYLSTENAYQFERTRKNCSNKRKPQYQQFLKANQLRLSNSILAAIAKIHMHKPNTYNQIKNFLICPYGYNINQQPTYKIAKSQQYYSLLRQSLNYLMFLHRFCIKSNPKLKEQSNAVCHHLVTLYQKIKNQV